MYTTWAHFKNPCLTFEMYRNTIEKDKEIYERNGQKRQYYRTK